MASNNLTTTTPKGINNHIMSEIIEVKQADMLAAINKSDVDIQISTAKQYPMHTTLEQLTAVLNKISTYATMDSETAEDCFYALRRNGAGGTQVIEGLSVRMAEIIATCWGNLRIQTRIIGNDGKTITAQGVCHDLESNVATSVEVKRRITDKYGKTYSEDMQVVTGNAAAAIAFRNAVLKVVPKSVTKKVIAEVKQVALGKSIDLETSRQNLISYYAKIGVTEQMLYEYLQIKKREEIDKEMVFELRATANAIKEGTTTIQESFVKPVEERKMAEEGALGTFDSKNKASIVAINIIGGCEDVTIFDLGVKEIEGEDFDYYKQAKKYLCIRKCYQTTVEDVNPINKKALIALNKLMTIAQAWNKEDGFVPDFSNRSQYKWFPWFHYSDNDAGFVFATARSAAMVAGANLGSRICFKTEERARKFGQQFIDLWNDFLL